MSRRIFLPSRLLTVLLKPFIQFSGDEEYIIVYCQSVTRCLGKHMHIIAKKKFKY